MRPSTTGKFISQKRKELNLTQEQLAEKLGVSNKTVSKWETGKCMPDYAVVKSLCRELGVTVAELIEGEETAEKNSRAYDDQLMELFRRTQELEKQRSVLYGLVLTVMGIALMATSHLIGGSALRDFLSGVLLGISVGEMIVGVICVITKALAGR